VRTTTELLPGLILIPLFLLSLSGQPVMASAGSSSPQYAPPAKTWSFPRVVPPSATDPGSVPSFERPGASSSLLDPGWDFTANMRTHPEEGGQHLWPDIAVGPGGLVAVAWMDDHATGGYGIFYSTTSDGGVTWSMPERVDTRVTGSYSKFVDMDFTPSGIPVLVWEDDREGEYNVYLSKRDPGAGGTPWTANRKVNTTGSPPGAGDFMDPSIAVLDDARYFVAWTDWREGVFHQVYGRASRDGGVTWGTEFRISDGLGYQPVAGAPCLVVDPTSGLPGQEILCCVTNDWRGNVPGGRYPNVYSYRSADALPAGLLACSRAAPRRYADRRLAKQQRRGISLSHLGLDRSGSHLERERAGGSVRNRHLLVDRGHRQLGVRRLPGQRDELELLLPRLRGWRADVDRRGLPDG
jgi:hypothetical protein